MKRMKESGAAFRKKRKMRIEHEKRDKDAMLKYIRPTQRLSLKTQEQPEASEIISGTAFPAATDDVLSCCSSAEIDIACEVTLLPPQVLYPLTPQLQMNHPLMPQLLHLLRRRTPL